MENIITGGPEDLIVMHGVCQRYFKGGQEISVLANVDFALGRGSSCAIVGGSGSGKSTLLNILGLLEPPASGDVQFAGCDVMNASPDELALLRNREIGFVFQAFNLLPRLSAIDNVALPLMYRGIDRGLARERALCELERVGLANRALHRPADLSGGQRQRVAIARALVGQPKLVLADEPTGNLDHRCATQVMDLLHALNREHNVTLVMVTHDTALAKCFQRRVEVMDGQLLDRSDHVAT